MIGARMPSPIGHALGGVAAAWTADLVHGRRDERHRLLLLYMALAAAPDLDLLVPGSHRMATHSLFAMLLVFIIAAAVTAQVTPRRASRFGGQAHWRTAAMCAAAYGSHLLLDWLGADNVPPRGIQLLWPVSDRWFISDLDLFRQTARQHFLSPAIMQQNAIAVAQELAIMAPVVALLWWARARRSQSGEQRD
jgi:membrane-bound metal-dependent hydrolase YbcI (DUF457 family)